MLCEPSNNETTHSGCFALHYHPSDPESEQKAWYTYMLFIKLVAYGASSFFCVKYESLIVAFVSSMK